MKHDERLSGALHAILHIAAHEGPMTSEALAACMRTNPVVVRRTMAGLREAGIVNSGRGHGGGWTLGRDLGAITLLDVHTALGGPELVSLPILARGSRCRLEAAVTRVLTDAHAEASALLAARMAATTLADLYEPFSRHNPGKEQSHA